MQRVAREHQSMGGKSEERAEPERIAVWWCHSCLSGPQSISNSSSCADCFHIRCSACDPETVVRTGSSSIEVREGISPSIDQEARASIKATDSNVQEEAPIPLIFSSRQSPSPPASLTDASTVESNATDKSNTHLPLIHRLAQMLLSHGQLHSQLFRVVGQSSYCRSVFVKQLRGRLTSLARELKIKAENSLQDLVADFIKRRSGEIAKKLLELTLSQTIRILESAPSDLSKISAQDRINTYIFNLRQDSEPDSKVGPRPLDQPDEEYETSELRNDFQQVTDFILASKALHSMRTYLHILATKHGGTGVGINPVALGRSFHRVFHPIKIYRGFWEAWPQDTRLDTLPPELRLLAADQIELQRKSYSSTSDYWKKRLEHYSGESWIWWPLNPPQSQALIGFQRVRWICRCGQERQTDIPDAFAQSIRRFLLMPQIRPAGSNSDGQIPSPNGSSGSLNQHRNPSSPFCARHNELSSNAGSNCTGANALPTHLNFINRIPYQLNVHPSLFVLFCTYRGDRLRFSQIDIRGSMDDNDFVAALLHDYRHMIGELRYWLHPRVLSFCSFAKYTRDTSEHLSKHREPELPLSDDYNYENRPIRGDPYTAPISEHEWYDHLYSKTKYMNRCRCALGRIPKRKRRFVFCTQARREDMFGLFAERRPSFFRVAIWTLSILTAGVVVLVWWLANHPADLQNAATPVSLCFMAVAWIWVPLNEHFNRKF